MSELNLILLGPPGAGKGTQADRLKDDFGLPYIGTGDLLRKHKDDGTELGREAAAYMEKGDLVPDELVIRMILEEIEEKGADGFLLDGYPRTVAPGRRAGRGARGERAPADGGAADRRRRRDRDPAALRPAPVRQSGHLYHVEFDPPKNEDVCDH